MPAVQVLLTGGGVDSDEALRRVEVDVAVSRRDEVVHLGAFSLSGGCTMHFVVQPPDGVHESELPAVPSPIEISS